ncbi:MBL fold metallo-hydrolase [Candidatus Pacearchaeota archaeon]|nr:MBL fold metallo-hydrolase [Candidatus Pacearchaeota archaeon]
MRIGKINLKFLGNSGFLIENDKKIYIDPYNISENLPKADIILASHGHYDHCSLADIEKIVKKGTIIVVSADCQSKITRIEDVNMQIIELGDELNFEGIRIQAVPAYNPKKQFHPKSEGWMGYIIKFENIIIYHAGDTDKIPEMEKLTGYGKQGNEFIALLPVGGNYTMDASEAAEAASLIKPTLAIPMHYGAVAGSEKDADNFVKLCFEFGIKAIKLEKEI